MNNQFWGQVAIVWGHIEGSTEKVAVKYDSLLEKMDKVLQQEKTQELINFYDDEDILALSMEDEW